MRVKDAWISVYKCSRRCLDICLEMLWFRSKNDVKKVCLELWLKFLVHFYWNMETNRLETNCRLDIICWEHITSIKIFFPNMLSWIRRWYIFDTMNPRYGNTYTTYIKMTNTLKNTFFVEKKKNRWRLNYVVSFILWHIFLYLVNLSLLYIW